MITLSTARLGSTGITAEVYRFGMLYEPETRLPDCRSIVTVIVDCAATDLNESVTALAALFLVRLRLPAAETPARGATRVDLNVETARVLLDRNGLLQVWDIWERWLASSPPGSRTGEAVKTVTEDPAMREKWLAIASSQIVPPKVDSEDQEGETTG